MDYNQYLVKTAYNATMKLGPMILVIGLGYILFIKLPFWLFRKGLKSAKESPSHPDLAKLEEVSQKPGPKIQHEKKAEPKKEQSKKEKPKPPPAEPKTPTAPSPEVIFDLKPGQSFTMDELKKKHRELLKACHPDRVAALDPEFKKLADRKSKEINAAYEKLKSKAN